VDECKPLPMVTRASEDPRLVRRAAAAQEAGGVRRVVQGRRRAAHGEHLDVAAQVELESRS